MQAVANGAHRVSAKAIVWCMLTGASVGYVDLLEEDSAGGRIA